MEKIYYDDKERTVNALEKIAEIKNNFAIHKQTDKRIANAVEKLAEDGIAKKSDVVKAVIPKGSVFSYMDLPKNPRIGDMYNIQNGDPDHGVNAGDNFVYTEEGWDNFGAYIDLSKMGPKWVKDVDGDGEESLKAVVENDVTGNTASGAYSNASGYQTTASGDNSHAEGYHTTASRTASHAEGTGTTASGNYSHAEGYSTTASGNYSHAEGYSTKAYGPGSHAEGYGTAGKSSNSTIGYAHAEGYLTTASGHASHAEGKQTTATNSASHAEGGGTNASGVTSHAEGRETTASGDDSHAEGYSTTASGQTSHAEGEGTTAARRCQHVFGSFNITDNSGSSPASKGAYIEIVGNGTAASAKSNARTLDWNGNEALAGSLTLGKGTADEVTVTAAQLKALLSLTGFVPGSY